MSNIELDNFDDYRNFIREKILLSEQLWKLIYHPTSNPLDEVYIEDPYKIFEEENCTPATHGFVLFKEKESTILNATTPVILISCSSNRNQNYDSIQDIKIEIKIIFKGEIIELADESNRAYRIGQLFSQCLDGVELDNNSKLRRESFGVLSLNEENYGFKLIFTSKSNSFTDEIQVYEHEQKEDAWGITRESYSLITTDAPIIVDVHQPQTDNKLSQQFGYNLECIRTMVCGIRPEITESSIIKYNDNYYRIHEIVEYEDYWICTLVITYDEVIDL